jgi:diphosphomevalonate decarboxylase
MNSDPVTAIAHPNIAFIKYWGNDQSSLRLPSNGSISMNLESLWTRTTVTWNTSGSKDSLMIDDRSISGPPLDRVIHWLDSFRSTYHIDGYAQILSKNNFPAGAGIASSASAFAALTVAASSAAGFNLSEIEKSILARRGSGSACRSIPSGFVEWLPGSTDHDSYAVSIASPDHWDLHDIILVFDDRHKSIGSTQGHDLASTSPFQPSRVQDAPRRLDIRRKALLDRDFLTFAAIIEQDCLMMHSVMMTSQPPIYYWNPDTLNVIRKVQSWRSDGLDVCFTIDAGANVHLICTSTSAKDVLKLVTALPCGDMGILQSAPGGPARLTG